MTNPRRAARRGAAPKTNRRRRNGAALHHALAWAARGGKVLPIGVREGKPKRPLIKGFTEKTGGNASDDPAQIRAWASWLHCTGFAILCGLASGVVVIDVDTARAHREGGAFDLLSLPPTLTHRTPSGGTHHFYAIDTEVRSIDKFAPGVELKGMGKYAVLPGSWVELVDDGEPWIGEYEVVEPAAEMVAFPLSRVRKSPQTSVEALSRGPGGIPEGQRHETMMSLAGWLSYKGLDRAGIGNIVTTFNNEFCQKGADEVRRIIDDAASYQSGSLSKRKGSLTLHGPDELATEPEPTLFLIRGVLDAGGYGPLGGKQKTLKSIMAYAGAIALASGKPMLGYEPWSVPEAKPVLIMAGEGGYKLAHRRVRRIARDLYGITDVSKLPIYIMEGVAEMNGDYFREKIREFVAKHGQPGLVILDSLYNFHDPNVEVGSLYSRGGMLSDYQHTMHDVCGSACALWVVDHLRKSATTLDLDEYMQSGMGQWAHTWWTAKHRRDADVVDNRFWLEVNIGSRESFGGIYEIDIDEGPLDEETGTYERPMKAEVRRSTARGTSGDVKAGSLQDLLDAVGEQDGIVTRKLAKAIGGRNPEIAIKRATLDGLIEVEPGARGARYHHLTENGRKMREHRVSLSKEPASESSVEMSD